MFPIFIPIPIFGGDGPRPKLWQVFLAFLIVFTGLLLVLTLVAPRMGWANIWDPNFCEPVKNFGRYDECKAIHSATVLLVPLLAIGYGLVAILYHLDKREEADKMQQKKDKQAEEWE